MKTPQESAYLAGWSAAAKGACHRRVMAAVLLSALPKRALDPWTRGYADALRVALNLDQKRS